MTDRELLELAAKAMGFEGEVTEYPSGYVEMGLTNHFNRHGSNVWRPLLDDGDALRLAVKLGILIDVRYTDPMTQKYNSVTYWLTTSSGSQLMFSEDLDPYTATRRAIVRAAADIGKQNGN